MIIHISKIIRNLYLRYRKFAVAKGTLAKFPNIQKQDKILIFAPHVDDEVISSAGLIQQAKKIGAQLRIVYVTNGDSSILSVLGNNNKFNPSDFIGLGQKRMVEGKKAAAMLGLSQDKLFFLGYPNGGLAQMLNKYFSEGRPYTSSGTRFNYNPYSGTFRRGQLYTGSNLLDDIKKIIIEFSPTIIIGSHPRDKHPDHKALLSFLKRVYVKNRIRSRLYSYLVHYKFWPQEKKLNVNEFLFPPRHLFGAKGWYSFNLSSTQEQIKLRAISQNLSQIGEPDVNNFLKSFVKRNEIFEKIN